ncbi:hypothetical protein ACTFIV_007276 [Dictyostelium citrinum]
MKYNYLILIIFMICFISVNTQEINKLNLEDYECIENLLTKLGTISSVNNFTTTIQNYNFCDSKDPSVTIICDYDKAIILELSLSSKNQNITVQDEFSCFKNLKILQINDIKVSDTFFQTIPSNVDRLLQLGDNLTFGKLPPNVHYFFSDFKTQSIPVNIKFSWISNLYQLIFGKTYSSINEIIFENDVNDDKEIYIPYISIFATKFPSFKNIKTLVELILPNGYDQSSWSEIKNCNKLTTLDVTSSVLTSIPTLELSQLRAIYLKKINFDLPLKEVESIIDLSLIGDDFEILNFKSPGVHFTLNGSFPILLPKNEKFDAFEFSNGIINSSIDFSVFSNVKTLKLFNNLLSTSIKSVFNKAINRKLIYLDVSNNSLVGTIDDSFCELDLIVSNNNLTGTIPSCFTCFFGLPSLNLESRFSGNNFSNLNNPSSPSIIIPNIEFGEVEEYYGTLIFNIYLFGENIGGNWVSYENINASSVYLLTFKILKPNKLILIQFSGFQLPKVMQLIYEVGNPNYTFTLSLSMTPPQLNTIDWETSTTNLIFDGSFFSYNKSIVNISIGNENCSVTNSTFNQIQCKLSNVIDSSLKDIISYITVGNLTTQFTLNPGVINKILNCTENYNDCNGNGYCLSDVGECKCKLYYQGDDCIIPYIQCNPINCSGYGTCINTTGICRCDPNHQGNDCSIPFIECPNECNKVGQCNNHTGICSCPTSPYGWSGINCTIPLQTISSVLPSNSNGGYASIYGWFGNIHKDPQVFIGNIECIPIYNISESEILCNAPPGTGIKSVSVIQNSVNVTANYIYKYYSNNDEPCPNDCTSISNGICNKTTGYCNCNGKWGGIDCSSLRGNNELPGSNITIDSNTGSANMTNQQTNYEISIIKLLEIDFNGNTINQYQLQNNWTFISNTSNENIYIFNQSIQNGQCNIRYIIEEIINDRQVSFAGINYKIESGSIKMTVAIENYQYFSNLNTLQLQMKSTVNQIQSNVENHCNNDQVEIKIIKNQDDYLNFIAIKKDGKVLNGRFIDRIESDSKSTFMKNILISKSNDSITIGMNLPHCSKKCLIDPDFSLLVSSEFKNECGDDKYNSWFLPVVIVVPIVFFSAIIATVYIIYKKRFVEAPFKNKIKMIANKKV